MVNNYCFAILAHGSSVSTKNLAGFLLGNPDFSVVLHLDKKSNISMAHYEEFKKTYNERFQVISVVSVKWGHFSMVQAMLSCIETSFRFTNKPDRITFLSGDTIPLLRTSELSLFFKRNVETNFIENHDMLTHRWIKCGVYNRRYKYFWPCAPRRYINTIVKFVNKLLCVSRCMPYDMHPYCGSQWVSLNNEAYEYIVGKSSSVKIQRFFNFTFIPDEMYFQTLLANSKFKLSMINKSLIYVNWHNNGRPKVFTSEDIEELRIAKKAGYFFARKANPRIWDDIGKLINI